MAETSEEASSESELESDLEDLYESFDYSFEDAGDTGTRQEASANTSTVDSVFSTALYPSSTLTVFQSHLLV